MAIKGYLCSILLVLSSLKGFSQFIEKQISTSNLSDVFMVNSSVGFAGGVDGIFKTSDGGQNWTLLPYFVSTYQSLDSIYFVSMGDHHLYFLNENVGYSVGWGGLGNYEQIVKTTDGGVTWQLQHVVNPDESPFQSPELRLRDIHSIDENTLITVGYRGRILKTTNGGSNWLVKDANLSENLNAIDFVSTTHGIIGGDGIALTTQDGGESWVTVSTGLNLLDISYLSEQELIGVTPSSVVKSFDGGLTWTPVNVPGVSNFSKLSFIDAQNGYVINNQSLLKTTDGGSTFEDFPFTNTSLTAVLGFSSSSIMLTSQDGKILYSNDPAIRFAPLAFFQLPAVVPCRDQPLIIENESYAGYSYVWYLDNVYISNQHHLNYTVTTFGSHVVTLRVFNAFKSASYSKSIITRDFPALPLYQLAAMNTNVCEGDMVNLRVQNLEPSKSLPLYNDNNEVIDTVINSWQPFLFANSTTVHIKLESSNECATNSGTHALTLTVIPKPSATVVASAEKSSVCFGEESFIEILNSEVGIEYIMTETHLPYLTDYYETSAFGNGGSLKIAVPAVTKAITYNVVGRNSYGCTRSYGSFPFTPRIVTVDFALHSIFELQNNGVHFINKSTADSYLWEFDEGASTATTTDIHPDITFSTSGEKTVRLTGSVQEGCSKTVEKKLTVFEATTPQPLTAIRHATLSQLDSTYIITDFEKKGTHLYIMGYIRGNPLLQAKKDILFVAKYTEDGSQLWMRKRLEPVSTLNTSSGSNFVMDADENIYATGTFMGTTFSIGTKVFNSKRLTHDDETRSILFKMDKEGTAIWGNIFEQSQASPIKSFSYVSLTDILVSNNKLYLYINSNEVEPVIVTNDTVYNLKALDNNYREGFSLMADTTGSYIKTLVNDFKSSTGSSRLMRVSKRWDGVDGLHTPGLLLYADTTLGVFNNLLTGGTGPYPTANYVSQLTFRISTPYSGMKFLDYPFVRGDNMVVFNWRSTITDPMTEQFYEVISFKDYVKHTPGIATLKGDTLNIVDGGIIFCRDINGNLLWSRYLPYAEILNVKVINSDVYVFGNFEDWMAVEAESKYYQGIKGLSNSAFVAKFNSKGQAIFISDLNLVDPGKNVLYAADADDCTNDFTILGVASNGYYIKHYSLDNDVSDQCLEVLFKASAREVLAGQAINFTDQSIGNPNQWEWSFEGAETSTSTNASPQGIVYTTPGVYNVTLTIHAGTRTDTRVLYDYITVLPPLQSAFTSLSQETIAGNTVNFIDQSEGVPTKWAWEFEGATPAVSTDQHPSVLYTNPGKYKVMLTVWRGDHASVKTEGEYIHVYAPILADFSATEQFVGLNGTIDFTSLSPGNPTAFTWTFEGGTPSSSQEQHPTGIGYTSPGTYKVSLTAQGNIQSNQKTVEGYITVHDLIADFSTTQHAIVAGNSIDFSDQSQGTPTQWNWIFEGGNPSSASTQHPGVNYTNPGKYKVTLTVSKGSYSTTKTVVDYITVHAPLQANFSSSKQIIGLEESINFTNLSTGGPTAFAWAFEGGTPSSSHDQNPTGIIYSNPGTFKVSLLAQGNIQSNQKLVEGYITVQDLTANFSANKHEIVAGGAINFMDQSIGSPTQWAWTFEGGSPSTSMAQHPSVTYANPGKYRVILTVTKGDHSKTKTVVDYINVHAPLQANFSSSKQAIYLNEAINFSNLSTGTPTEFLWTFEGGTPSSSQEQHPVGISYAQPGTYKVSLIVHQGTLQTTQKTVDGYITVQDLVADFSSDKNSVVVNESVSLTDLSSGSPQHWKWNTEGGTPETSESNSTTIIYAFPGQYDVSLTASRGSYTHTLTKTNFITVYGLLVPDFSSDKVEIMAGESVNFQDHSAGDIATYAWSFPGGEPTSSTQQHPQGIVYKEAGEYDVRLQVTGNIQSKMTIQNKLIKVSVITATEEAEDTDSEIILYPNPSTGTFLVKSSVKLLSAELYNNVGAKIETVNTIMDNEVTFTASPGLYLVKLQMVNGQRHLKKVIIK